MMLTLIGKLYLRECSIRANDFAYFQTRASNQNKAARKVFFSRKNVVFLSARENAVEEDGFESL